MGWILSTCYCFSQKKKFVLKKKKQKTFIKLITSWIVASEFYFSRNFQWHIKVLHFQFYCPIKIYFLAYQYIYIYIRKIFLLQGTQHIKSDTFEKIDKHCIHFAKVYNICHFLCLEYKFMWTCKALFWIPHIKANSGIRYDHSLQTKQKALL